MRNTSVEKKLDLGANSISIGEAGATQLADALRTNTRHQRGGAELNHRIRREELYEEVSVSAPFCFY